jgi:hypothetical protein
MTDYTDIDITSFMIDKNSLGAKPSNRVMAMKQDNRIERSPYLPPTSVSKGDLITTLGGVTTFMDKTGGTTVFTYDPQTAVITMNGGVVVNQTLNLGTIFNTNLTGTTYNDGVLNLGIGTQGTIYNNKFTTGTMNTSLFISGTMGSSNINTTTLESGTIGTSSIIGGTATNLTISGGTVSNSSVIGGTLNYPIFNTSAGSSALSNNGAFELQTYGGSLILAVRLGTVTYRFTPSGVL